MRKTKTRAPEGVNVVTNAATGESKTAHTSAVPCTAMPDYDIPCEVCKNVPTVVLINPKTLQVVHHTLLCGCCCWGEAKCLDPDNW